MKNIAPLVLFTYNRLNETKATIKKILDCDLIHKTPMYIYSDGAKNDLAKKSVDEVREYLRTLSNYENINIVYSESNKGLAASVIAGVTEIVNKYGKVIVLEDDLLVSKDFLIYMNEALKTFESRKDIWSISGFGPNIEIPKDYNEDIYLTMRGCSWGWATWKDRWETVDWNVSDFQKLKASKKMKKEFNISGNDMFRMLELQMMKKINSWAIRWCYSQFKQQKYTVYPVKSKVKNIGFGEDATHGGIFVDKHIVQIEEKKINFNSNIEKSLEIIKNFQKFNDLTIKGSMGYFLKKYGLGYNFVKRLMKIIIRIKEK